jgi:hypothetical protein
MDQGRAEACRIMVGQINLVRVSKTVLPMLRAASLPEAGLHLLQRFHHVSPLAGKAITSGELHAISPETMTAYSDRLSVCLAKGRLPGRKIQVAC